MKKVIRFYLFIIPVLLLSCSNPKKNAALVIEEQWHTHETELYSIRYSYDWKIDTAIDPRLEFALTHRPKAKRSTNLILHITKNDSANTLEKFEADINQGFETYFPNGKLLESEIVKNDMGRYYKIVLTCMRDGLPYKLEQRIWMQNNLMYQFAFGGEPEEFDKVRASADQVMDTFTIK